LAKGEYFKRHIDTATTGAGIEKAKAITGAAVGAKWKAIADSPIFHVPDRFCSVFIYLNDAT